MNRFFALVCLLPLPAIILAADTVDPMRPAMEQAIARVKPALVRIQVVWVDYSQGREVKHEASGSGFIIRKEGFVVTNHHVAGRATRAVSPAPGADRPGRMRRGPTPRLSAYS